MAIFKRVVGKLKKGLERTRESFVGGLRSMLAGRKLDEQLISELESRPSGPNLDPARTVMNF